MSETFHGFIKTLEDAMLLINSVETGHCPPVQQRLSQAERRAIRSGSCFVWCQEESNISRWTDGLCWSASRIHGHFLVYKQHADKAKIENGLIKKTISFKTLKKNKYHLICYYKKQDIDTLDRPVDVLANERLVDIQKPLYSTANELKTNIGSWIDSKMNDQFFDDVGRFHVNQLNKYLEF